MQYAPPGRLPPSTSVLVVDGVVGIGLMLWVGTLLVLALRQYLAIRRARGALADPRRLHEGPALVEGRVALANGERGSPVSLTVIQEGARHEGEARGATIVTMEWTEVERTVRARPFYLALRNGSRLRVEPAGHVELIDDLELPEPMPTRARVLRRRRAKLDRGERVVAQGALERGFDPEQVQAGYRGPSEALVLRPHEGAIAFSTEPLGQRSEARARLHLRAALVGFVTFAALYGGWFRDFRLLHAHGRVVEATVLAHQVRPSGGKGQRREYGLDLALPTGEVVHDDTNVAAFDATHDGDRAPVTVTARRSNGAQIGRGEVGIGTGEALFALGIVALLMLGHASMCRWAKPWFERARVVDHE